MKYYIPLSPIQGNLIIYIKFLKVFPNDLHLCFLGLISFLKCIQPLTIIHFTVASWDPSFVHEQAILSESLSFIFYECYLFVYYYILLDT